MKKKLLLAAAAIAAGALLIVGASLAFYTDSETAVNVVTTGNVDIEMKEIRPTPGDNESWMVSEKKDDEGKSTGLGYTNILPGATIIKEPVIKNIGTNNAYIRLKVKVSVRDAATRKELDQTGIEFYKDGISVLQLQGNSPETENYIYANNILLASKTSEKVTTSLFNQVKFPTTWGNEYANANIEITVVAEAVQSDNINVGKDTGVEATKKAFQKLGNDNVKPYPAA